LQRSRHLPGGKSSRRGGFGAWRCLSGTDDRLLSSVDQPLVGHPARTAQPGQLPPPRFAIPAAQPNGLSFCSAVRCPAPVEFHPFAQLSRPAVPSTYEFSSVANLWINQGPWQCSGTVARRSRSSGAACCDVKRPEPIGLLAVYTGIRCQPFFARAIPVVLLFGGSRRTAPRACRAGRGKGEVLAGTGPLGEEPRLWPGGNWTYRTAGRGKRGLFVEVMA
jgi:hypothetical protein